MSDVIDIETAAAENDAEIFSLLASFYNMNPELETVVAMRGLTPELVNETEVAEALGKIKSFAEKFNEKDEDDILAVKRDWTKLFRGIAPDYGPKAPYEELYLKKRDVAGHLKKLTEIYLEAGYTTYAEHLNRQDYIGIQLDFIGTLGLLRMDALEKGDDELYVKLTDTSENFLNEHIKVWFESFYRRAQEHIQTDYFRGVLDLTLLMLR
ncbi:hypothetical protein Dacet_2101 [Denitrovibrio acetiphilus DSM 12809]|uniref:Cytoplasmic chaperone TorD family protein n=1 Tax=Denitrovibrio acetiphilus (strain DSM 12809 / NBRC 114555 / N2460) TaxID=522772 RepID=D4H273_DENA2|nr:molecular chaperone TorD family protein [Denitrovibrio acetiphilus]ADD68864.1 hypothetical protein Dacet_2101 [Denitrovibrio acetiphilus DSM 12809]